MKLGILKDKNLMSTKLEKYVLVFEKIYKKISIRSMLFITFIPCIGLPCRDGDKNVQVSGTFSSAFMYSFACVSFKTQDKIILLLKLNC
jgi:hypothetical protein